MKIINHYTLSVKYRLTVFSIILTFTSYLASGQVLNDECRFAIPLPSADNYCSDDAQFTNKGATADPIFPNGCLG